MDYNYDRKTFLDIISNYEKELEKNKDSNYKVLKAIKD